MIVAPPKDGWVVGIWVLRGQKSTSLRLPSLLVASVRYFGRYRTGWVRDGVLLSIAD
jgi:hypothetical protein